MATNKHVVEPDEEKNVTERYWVAELFPPKYTTNDLVTVEESVVEKKSKLSLAQDFYSRIYSQIVLEEEIRRRSEIGDVDEQKNQTKSFEGEENVSKIPCAEILNVNESVLWGKEEMVVFKRSYEKLKEKTVKLLCILESRNLKLDDLKSQNKNLRNDLNLKEKENRRLKQDNEHFRAYISSYHKINDELEQKLQYFETCNNDLTETIQKLQLQKNELNDSLAKFKRDNEKSKATLVNVSKKYELKFSEQEQAAKVYYESIIDTLERERATQDKSLHSILFENSKYKKSLSVLQQHFEAGKNPEEQTIQTKLLERSDGEFLNVVDI